MFIATTSRDAWLSSVGARRSGMTEILARQIPLLNPSENEHMPLLPELGGPFGTCGYKHGAPNRAF